ncbi:condensin complex component cnd2 [Vairimorpha ceranae]|uniref:Condensin complex subunit 2 n=1 Tax=Vairimorpha ceranae TaxID=40302 RepID=A0A0F9YSM5_9MICR|nr:condensin complex component cnd2 [Vairimorpha ceranae]KAF5140303.1 hypothetical protein G9O61_00g015590 [Vairimorpha ceranae]KKO75542.1 condensin complex component cnd2 [Vairimorpha ceranae]
MLNDDLNSWLKVVAENKVTVKNAWKSTLIDHFKDLKQFKDLQGVNFQKASCTLDGCVKVYSTRVDDVSEEAMKLLEGFNLEDTKKKIAKKKGNKTIETNLSNINIKSNFSTPFRDPVFLCQSKTTESSLLLSTLEISKDGVYRLYSGDQNREIKMCDLQIDKLFLEDKHICPTFLKIGEVENLIEDNLEPVNDVNYEMDVSNFDSNEEIEEVVTNPPIFKESHFSYFKGWAGPTHWKLRTKKIDKISNSVKQKEKFLLNFVEPIDTDLILLQGETLFDRSALDSRKKVNYNLPEDFHFEREDLYCYNLLEGSYNVNNLENYPVDDLILPDEPNVIIEEPIDEIVTEMPVEEVKDQYFFRREQKKVDIKKLKNNIISNLTKSKSSKLSEICKNVPNMYDTKEKKDISIHFCIVSLLHVANEKNLELIQKDNDIIIETAQDI